jgi:transposase
MINDDLHVVHARAAGLDVHKMSITATVRLCEAQGGESRCETREFSALPKGLGEMVEWLLGHGVTAAGMEGTGIYWQAPWQALDDAGIKVELYHAQHVKQLRGRKTDVADSRWLARICQFGLGSGSLVVSAEFRQLRVLSRSRRQLVRDRCRARNRVQKVLDRCGTRIGGILSDVFGMNGRRILNGLANGLSKQEILGGLSRHVRAKQGALCDALSANLSEMDCFALQSQLRQHDHLQQLIRETETLIDEKLAEFQSQLQLLETIPGVSHQSACDILIEIGGDISAFGNAKQFSSWAGLCPGNNESGGKRRNARSVRGNPHLRTVLTECALAAARTKGCQFRGYHKAIHIRRGYKRATVATAHKLAKTIYSVLTNQRPYKDPEFDYEALVVDRNASRWIRKLKEFGYIESPESERMPSKAAA